MKCDYCEKRIPIGYRVCLSCKRVIRKFLEEKIEFYKPMSKIACVSDTLTEIQSWINKLEEGK